MIKLYDFLPCPFGQKVRIVLAEKGLTYDLAQVDISKGENRHQDFFRLNPFGKVPVLVDDDATIYDSTIINEYLEDEYPEPPLLASVTASALRARARRLEDFADSSFTPQVGQLMAELGKPDSERNAERLQRLNQAVERVLDYLNQELAGQQFLAGDFSVADIGFIPRLLVLPNLGIEAGTNRPNVDAWIKRLLERPSLRSLQGVTTDFLAGV
jgi:glutathione S-transferase